MSRRIPDDIAVRSLYRALVGTVTFLMVVVYAIALSTRWVMMPHRFCLINDPFLVWATVVTNCTIGLAYFAIPTAMVTVVRAVPEAFFSPRLIYLFATFILACGLTHVMVVVTIWYPAYYAQVAVDGVCAIASVGTFHELVRAKPALTRFVVRLRRDDRRARSGPGADGPAVH